MTHYSERHDKYFDLREPEPERRRTRAEQLRITYILANPQGWDAQRLGPKAVAALLTHYGVQT